MNRGLLIALRIAGGVVMTLVMWWVGVRFVGVTESPFYLVAWVALISMCWFPFVGWPVISWLGEQAGSFYAPSDKNFQIRPEYSIAEARVQQGRYEEALAAFRADIEKFPDETYPHIRIAELQLDKLHNPDAAIAELRIALTKAQSEDAFALVAGRLADSLVQYKQDRTGAVEILQQINQRFPDSKYAAQRREKVSRLQ